MEQPAEKTVFSPRSHVGASTTDLFDVGDVVGQYKVEKVLGAGGMGVVYLVQHLALRKRFAIKVLPTKLAQEASFVARFKREAEMLARLKDPHIVNVTDFGESHKKLYLVLEYVDGGTLEDWFQTHAIKGRGLPATEVSRIVRQILQGLGHAHKAGIIHRDLKPANVLMEKSGEAKISDFGLARVAAEESYRQAGGTAAPFGGDSVTTTGTIVGTIDFMSPEARNMRPSDARSDLYAVGIMTYYLLTGKKPSGIAKPASQLVPGLDARWDKFLTTCLAEDPANRYQTAEAALDALHKIPVQPARKSAALLPTLILLLVAVGGFAAWKLLAPRSPSEPSQINLGKESSALPSKTLTAVDTRTLTLTGLPVGAQIVYRGEVLTSGPDGQTTLAGPSAPLAIKVRATGYRDWSGEVGKDPQATTDTVPLELVPAHAVRFPDLPPHAKVTINNETLSVDAESGVTFQLRPGRYTLTAVAPRYLDFSQKVEILPSTQSIRLALEKIPPPPEVLVELGLNVPLKFKWIPPGSFTYGSNPNEPGQQRSDLPATRHEITTGFYIAETEMTQQQHLELMKRNPSNSRALGDTTRPVEQVSWRDLTSKDGVLERLNAVLRRTNQEYTADLPTEVEWEYACRAGTETSYNNGRNFTNDHDVSTLSDIAHFLRGAGLREPAPVAQLKPNAWGLYDMHGNIAEWVHNTRNPRSPVLRGGHFKVAPIHCRSASRIELQTDARPSEYMGYRLVLRPNTP